MYRKKIRLLYESFGEIRQNGEMALQSHDVELMQYHFIRAYRCLAKLDELFAEMAADGSFDDLAELRSVYTELQMTLNTWSKRMADFWTSEGEHEKAEREHLAALSYLPKDADAYLQYAHATLRRNFLFVHKDFAENIEFVTRSNAYDVSMSLRRAKIAAQTALAEGGQVEPINYMLQWIEFMNKELEEKKLLDISDDAQPSVHLALAELEILIGMQSVKRKVKEIADWVIFNQLREEQGFKQEPISLHMVFSGNPGTGKTTVARILATILRALGVVKRGHLVEVDRSELVAEYVGQTAVKTMKRIREATDGILFIDEAYALTRSQGNDFGIEAVDTIVKAMEDKRNNLIVILAGYPAEMEQFLKSNPGLHSRFKNQIHFPDYEVCELMEISDVLLKQKQFRMTSQAKDILARIITNHLQLHPQTHGNGRMVRNIIEEAILDKASQVVEQKDNNQIVSDLELIDESIMRTVEQEFSAAQHQHSDQVQPNSFTKERFR